MIFGKCIETGGGLQGGGGGREMSLPQTLLPASLLQPVGRGGETAEGGAYSCLLPYATFP